MNVSTVIICMVIAAVCIYSVFSYSKRLKGGCCGGGGGEIKVKPAADSRGYANRATVYIDGMTCSHCKLHVENAFNSEDGFCAVVDLKSKCAHVRAKETINDADMRKIVEKSGYSYVKTVHE